ncbi:hypothetical protein NL676_031023 [Syzygium grande]|nr:hypothetical protein NL676_031023 [Syzygium grande]
MLTMKSYAAVACPPSSFVSTMRSNLMSRVHPLQHLLLLLRTLVPTKLHRWVGIANVNLRGQQRWRECLGNEDWSVAMTKELVDEKSKVQKRKQPPSTTICAGIDEIVGGGEPVPNLRREFDSE